MEGFPLSIFESSWWKINDMTPVEALQKYFGFGEFRDGQLEIIEAILRGENAFSFLICCGCFWF